MNFKIDGPLSKLKSFTNRLMDFDDENESGEAPKPLPIRENLETNDLMQNTVILQKRPNKPVTSKPVASIHPFIHILGERKQLLNWTVEDISQQTGIPSSIILDVENGIQTPDLYLLEKYAKALGFAITLIEETPIEDLLEKKGTTEIIASLQFGQIAFGTCGKYIKKDPSTKAIWECTKNGELIGVLGLTEDVMQANWVILVNSKNNTPPTKPEFQVQDIDLETDKVDHADPAEIISQTELEKEIFLNVIYSDLDNPQLYSYLLTVKDNIKNNELFVLVHSMCEKLQSIREIASDQETSLNQSSLQEIEQDIHESKEKILQYFFKDVDLHKKVSKG